MIILDDEEKKKRYERAQTLTRTITGESSTNFNNIVLNNIQGETDEEKEYINRFNRARELTNSINPRENVPAPSATPEQIAKSKKVASYILEDMQRGRETNSKYGQGNIDLTNRKIAKNDDGSISTVRSISIEEDGKEVLIPTIINGKVVSDEEAIKHYHETGEYLGKFNSVDEANAYAEKLHKQQEKLYSNESSTKNEANKSLTKNIEYDFRNNNLEANNAMNVLKQTNIQMEKTPENVQNAGAVQQLQEKNNKNVFGKIATWLKDMAVSIPVGAYNAMSGAAKSIKEGFTERKEMLNNMSDEEVNQLANKQIAIGTGNSRVFNILGSRNKLLIEDTLQDFASSQAKSISSMVNNIINFFSGGNKGNKKFTDNIIDNSVLKNSEQYGEYSSKEDLTKSIQEDSTDRYVNMGIYNPSANKVGEIATTIIESVLLKKAGVGSTASIVTPSAINTYGQTGSAEEATSSAVQSYVFSKILNSKLINGKSTSLVAKGSNVNIKGTFKELGIKGTISNSVKEMTSKIAEKSPELFNTELKQNILKAMPETLSTFITTGGSQFVAGETTAIMQNGIDALDKEKQKDIALNSVLWATISAGINGYNSVKIENSRTTLNATDTKKQLKEWYSELELDPDKTYTQEQIHKQYRQLAKKYHTDITGDNDKMSNINQIVDALNKYYEDGTITKVDIKVTPTNKTTQNTSSSSDLVKVENENVVYVNTNSVLNEVAKNIVNENAITATMPITDNDRFVGFENQPAIPFEVDKSQLPEIDPAIVTTEDGLIDVIDINSGTKLLTGEQEVQNAINKVTEALQSKDTTMQNLIMNKVTEMKYDSVQAMDNLMSTIEDKLQNLKDVSDNIRQISDNSIYSNDEVIQILQYVNSKIDNVHLIEQSGTKYINSLDKDRNVLAQQKIDKTKYTGAEIKEIVNNAVYNADLSNINSNADNTMSQNKQNDTIEQNNILSQQVNSQENKIAQNGFSEQTNGNNISTENKSFEDVAYESMQNTETQEIKSPLQNRNIKAIGKQKDVNAYQYDNPEVKPYFKEMAQMIGEDLSYISSSDNRSSVKGGGTKLNTSTKAITTLHDEMGYSYDQIAKGLQNIIEDSGKENNAVSKKLELIIDDQLRNGYRNALGNNIAPNQNYINTINKDTKRVKNNISKRVYQKEIDNYKEISKKVNKVNGEVTEISNNILDGISKKKQSSFINEYLKNEVKGNDYYVDNEKIIANGTTIGKLKNGRTNFNKNVPQDIRYELKANIIGNLKNILSTSRIYQKDRIDTKNHSFADTFDRRKSYVKYKGNKYEIMFEIGKKDKRNTLYSIENIKKVGNISSGTSREETSKTPKKVDRTNVPKDIITQNKSSVKSTAQNTNIEDFGEKIGGARKDTSMPRTTIKTSKEVIHDYTVTSTENGYSVNFKGKVLQDGFKTQKEAEEYILAFKDNVKSHLATVEKSHLSNEYIIKILNPRTLKASYTNKKFSNLQDAESYAMALSIYLKENGKNLFRPQIQKVERINQNSKNATKTTGDNILSNFEFKGGEFGNWVTQNERQQFLNYAQDAFTDLAAALEILPSDLGQNGDMSIAFGARGKGLTGAVAHFEPGKKVINMTRLKGAGSLAHEYGHSIDNWLSRISGYDKDGMATENAIARGRLPDNLRKAVNEVTDALNYNTSKNQEEVDKKNAIYEKQRISSLEEYHLKDVDRVFEGKATTYKYNRTTKKHEQVPIKVTEEQKNEYQKIRKILIEGKLKDTRNFDYSSLSSNKVEYDKPLEDLRKLYKEVVGRKLNDDTVYGIYSRGKASKQVTEVKTESAYRKSAIELDKMMGRKSLYYSRTDEMWARAFEAYVSDKLKAKGIIDTYLVHSVNNNEYALFNPFPAGEERQNINKAFDNLIQTMKDEGILHDNIIIKSKLESTKRDNGIRYLKKNTDGNLKKPPRTKGYKEEEKVNGYELDSSGNITQPKLEEEETDTQEVNTNNQKDVITEEERKKLINKSKTNGEREDAFIEQAIQKVFKNGEWDENIEPISTTDIVNYIGEFFENKIEKGHFRENAYGLYKEDRDIIRTESLKDIDSIMHEVFHRIFKYYNMNEFVDKMYNEVVTDELLDLYKDLRSNDEAIVNEGFAEFGRRYIVQKNWVEKNMPKTIEFLNKRRKEFSDLNEFIVTMQKKVHDYIYQEPSKRNSSNTSFAPRQEQKTIKDTIKSAKYNLEKNLFNKDYAIEYAADYFVKGLGYVNSYELEDTQNPVIQNAMKNGINDAIDSILKDGFYDLDTGEKLCDGIADLGEMFDNTQEYKDFVSYIVALRAVEANEKGLKTGIRYDDAKYTIDKFSKSEKFQKAKKLYQDFNNTLMKQIVKSGLYSEEDVQNMKEAWENYAPFLRVMDNTNEGSGGKNPLKRFKGSERDIVNPIEGTIIMLGRIYPAMQRNMTIKKLIDLGEITGLGGEFYDIIPAQIKHVATEHLSDFKKELEKQGVDTSELDLEKTYELFYPDFRNNPRERITSYKANGKEVTIQFRDGEVSKDLYDIFAGNYSPDVPNFAQKFLKNTATIFRYGTTILNPAFVVNNISSDTQQASINAKGNFKPYIDSYKGLADVVIARGIPQGVYDKLPNEVKAKIDNFSPEYKKKIKKYYALYKQSGASGGSRTSLYTNRNKSSKYTADIMGNNYKDLGIKKNKFKSIVDNLSIPSELSEEATRFGVFVKNMEKKLQNSEFNEAISTSAYNTRNATQDFSTSGKGIAKLTPYIPYMSAKVGSIENARIIYKQLMGEAAREYKKEYNKTIFKDGVEEAKRKATEKVAKVWAKKIFMTAIFAGTGFLLRKMYKDDASYEEINEQKKQNNYYVKVGDKWFKIKKAQGENRLWINLGEYLSDLTSGNIENSGEALGSILINAVEDTGFSEDLSAFLPPIFSTAMELASNYDYYYASEIVPNYMRETLEPRDWYDESTSETSKAIGKLLNWSPKYLDYFVKNAFGNTFYDIWSSPDKLLGLTSNFPSKANTSGGAFTINPYSSSNSVSEVYDKYEEYKQKTGSGTITEEENVIYKKVSEARTAMGKINSQIRDIKSDLTTSKKEKEKQIIELQKQRTDIARQALGKDLINESSSSQVKSYSFYPSTSTLSMNNNKLELSSDMKQEYANIAMTYYEKYEKQGLYSEEKLKELKTKAKDYAKKELMKKYKSQLTKSK